MAVDAVGGNDSVHYQFSIQKLLEGIINFLASVIFHLCQDEICFLLKYTINFFELLKYSQK